MRGYGKSILEYVFLTLLMSLVKTPEASPNSVALARLKTPSISLGKNMELLSLGPSKIQTLWDQYNIQWNLSYTDPMGPV